MTLTPLRHLMTISTAPMNNDLNTPSLLDDNLNRTNEQ